MATPLRLVHRDSTKKSITAQEFIDDLFSSPRLDREEAETPRMREAFQVRPDANNHEEFTAELFRFYAHKTDWFSQTKTDLMRLNRQVAIGELTRWYGRPLHEAERDAFYVRNGGGIIGVIDKMTETIAKEQMEAYFDSIFFDYLPVDQDVRIRLAEELLERFGSRLYSGPDMKKAEILAANIEHHLKTFAMMNRQMTNQVFRW